MVWISVEMTVVGAQVPIPPTRLHEGHETGDVTVETTVDGEQLPTSPTGGRKPVDVIVTGGAVTTEGLQVPTPPTGLQEVIVTVVGGVVSQVDPIVTVDVWHVSNADAPPVTRPIWVIPPLLVL